MSKKVGKKPVEKLKHKAHEVVRAESASAPERRYRAVVFRATLVLFACGFAILTFLVKTTPSIAIDLEITRAIQLIDFPLFGLLMNVISWPGFSPQSMIITVLTILLIYGLGLHWEAVMALFAVVFSTGLNLLAKGLVQRPRPSINMVNVFDVLNDYSFPSGHVMFYISFLGFIGFLVFSLLKPSFKRSLLLVLFGGPVVLIGASRIYLGAHWGSDVLGAYLLGTLILLGVIQLYLWGKTRFFVHPPVAAEAEPQSKSHSTQRI